MRVAEVQINESQGSGRGGFLLRALQGYVGARLGLGAIWVESDGWDELICISAPKN